jgi:DNA invertase Pin-like site-specific DNA recombinase
MTKPRAAAIYARISQDRGGEGLGVTRQRRDCSEWAEGHGWAVAEIYTDDDISAYNGKHRPAYRRLLADIAERRRDGLVVWHPDRLHRSPLELEEFIAVIERAATPIGTVTAGDVDLASPSGRMVARILGATARQESEHKSERIRRKVAELAENGRVPGGGRRPFGYEPGGLVLREDEAAHVREAADRVLAGEGLHAVATDWNRRGVRTVSGVPWSNTTLKRLLRSGRISGQREHHDRVVAKGEWPAILDPAETTRLRAILDDPARDKGRGRGPTLLGGLLRCGGCGARMVSRPVIRHGQRIRRYFCAADHGGCNRVGIAAEPLEELVTGDALIALDGPAVRRALAKRQKPKNGAEAALRAAEAREAELATLWAKGELSKAAWSAARDQLARELETARSRVAGQVTEDAAAELVGQGASLAKRWEDLDTDRRRAVIRAVLEAVVIAPTTRAGNRFDEGRVSYVWRA